jgi:peptidylprolyl isomerase
MPKVLLTIVACFALLLAGCGSDSSSTSSSSEEASTTAEKTEESAAKETEAAKKPEAPPKVTVPKGPPPKKLEVKDLHEGSGVAARPGRAVTVSYVGVNYKTGKEFDSYWHKGGEPFTFTLGSGEVIPGWDQGLDGMKAGGLRKLIIPPQLAYGAKGVPPAIPPSETLVFVVELEAVEETGAAAKQGEEAAKKKTKPKVSVPNGPPPQKLVVKDLEEGRGPEAKPGDEVVVNYVGVNYKTGKEFGTSWNRDPLVFKLGEGFVIDGWEMGIAGMKPGGRRELVVPPDLGYGNHPTETIPPESTLVFVVDLMSVK